jgi:putative ABC transport system substrate-binding protein
MKRRDLLLLAGGLAASQALEVRAQSPGTRRLGIIMAVGKQAPEYSAARAAFREDLERLGWREGDNLIVDERWGASDQQDARAAADEIVALKPDVVLGQSLAVIDALKLATRTTPIVFIHVADPVASGLVASLAHPGGNVTGITNIEPSIGGKWLQFLKEAAPTLARAAMLVNPATQPDRGAIFLSPFAAAAGSLGVNPVNGEVHDLPGIEAVMSRLAAMPGGGAVVIPDAFFASHSAQIVSLAARLRLPVVYPYRYYIAQGGLLSYGVNNVDLFRQAAPYVARILNGTKPADLPVQQPIRFQLVLNLKTAKALGLTLPPLLLARADEVIE